MKNYAADTDADRELEGEDSDFKPLTSEEAQEWRTRNPQMSVWRFVVVQAVVGVLVALVAWLVTGRAEVGWSAAYGALSVVLPAALFARAVVRKRPGGAAAAMVGMAGNWCCALPCWRLHQAGPGLSWLALLAGLVVVMKTYWVALIVRSSVRKPIDI